MLYAGYRKPGEPNQAVKTFETAEDGLTYILNLASPADWQNDTDFLYAAIQGFELSEHGETVEMFRGVQYFVVSQATWGDLEVGE